MAGVIILWAFFLLPANRYWFRDRIMSYWSDFRVQKKNLSEEYRKVKRFDTYYTCSKTIAAAFADSNRRSHALVLLPPTDYFKLRGMDYRVPEPAVFYYFTGLKTIWANSHKAMTANWYVYVKNGKIIVDSVTDPARLADTLATFRKFNFEL
jgi:hypothetical protein